jgi:hypothetical protein
LSFELCTGSGRGLNFLKRTMTTKNKHQEQSTKYKAPSTKLKVRSKTTDN